MTDEPKGQLLSLKRFIRRLVLEMTSAVQCGWMVLVCAFDVLH